MTVAYNPSNKFEIDTWDVEFRRAPKRMLMARVYQPQGDGPFPVLLDLHGGAWNNQDRTANEMMDANIARSGILVVAIDLTARRRGALSRFGARRQLWSALAQVQSAGVERRSGNDRRARQLERRPRNRAVRHEAARSLL